MSAIRLPASDATAVSILRKPEKAAHMLRELRMSFRNRLSGAIRPPAEPSGVCRARDEARVPHGRLTAERAGEQACSAPRARAGAASQGRGPQPALRGAGGRREAGRREAGRAGLGRAATTPWGWSGARPLGREPGGVGGSEDRQAVQPGDVRQRLTVACDRVRSPDAPARVLIPRERWSPASASRWWWGSGCPASPG
jgi:hypothetical protein